MFARLLESAGLFAWGWAGFVGSAFFWLLGKWGESHDFVRFFGWRLKMPPSWLFKMIAVALAFAGAFFSFHQMRMDYEEKLVSEAAGFAELAQDNESLRNTLATLGSQANLAGSMIEAQHRKIDDLEALVGEVEGVYWFAYKLKPAPPLSDGTIAEHSQMIYVVPGLQPISPALVEVRCRCKLIATQLDVITQGPHFFGLGEIVYSDTRDMVSILIAAPTVSRTTLIKVLVASETEIEKILSVRVVEARRG